MKGILHNILYYDFEVFQDDWFLVAIDSDGPVFKIHNDAQKLNDLYNAYIDNIWVGYNSRRYDQYILKGILLGMDPKKINDFIIRGGNGWEFPGFRQCHCVPPLIDYDVLKITDSGLKSLEGMMGNDIRETTVPFDINRPLTDAEKEEVFFYCEHDVRQTMEVYKRRSDDFEAIRYFIEHFKLQVDEYSKTKAQLAAMILGGNRKGKRFRDVFDFQILDCLRLDKYKPVENWYRDKANHDYTKRQKVTVAGVPHTFAWGGGHGALEKFHADGTFLNIDVTSYYPSLQMKYLFGQRVMDKWENFEFIHNSNLQFKAKGDKKARLPFKIMDNAISGQLKQETSALYDPKSNNEICINGQLLLLDLIEHLEPHCKLIQNNTDGVIVQIDSMEKKADVEAVVHEWEERTGMHMEIETFVGTIYQKDVNNYFLIDRQSGETKSKGAYVMLLDDLRYELAVVNNALRAYMTDGTPVEETILNCNSLKDFQLIARIGSKWSYLQHGDERLKERCVRIFASTDAADMGIFKVKEAGGKPNKFQNSPSHCFIVNTDVNSATVPEKLDKDWYIDQAHKRLAGFGITDAPIPARAVKVKKPPANVMYKGLLPVAEGTKAAPAMSYKDRGEYPEECDLKYETDLVAPLDKDTVLIDIDNQEQAERLFEIVKQYAPECTVIKTTRGLHFLFRNNGQFTKAATRTYLAVGIQADIKLGSKNGLEKVRQNGGNRKIIHGENYLAEGAQRAPLWLAPIKTPRGLELAASLFGLAEGSRNDTLFQYALELRHSMFANAGVKETIKIINKFLVNPPLDDAEVDTILRGYGEEGSGVDTRALYVRKPGGFMHATFGDRMAQSLNMVRTSGGMVYMYDSSEGIYTRDPLILEGEMREEYHNITNQNIKEVMSYLRSTKSIPIISTNAPTNLIAFKNGVYDLNGDLFRPFSQKYFIQTKIPWNYNPNAKSAVVDNFLKDITCNDAAVYSCILEMMGYCLYRRASFQKAFILLGDKSNGKSTFLRALAAFLGERNVSSLDVKSLGERFKTAELIDKLANIGDDISDEFMPDPSVFKKLVTGETVTAEYKGKDPFQFRNYSTLIFSANNLPRIKDKTGAVLRRLCVIPFNREFSPEDEGYDPDLIEKLTTPEAMERFGCLAISGLIQLLKQKKFTESPQMKEELRIYGETNNPIVGFFEQLEDNPSEDIEGRLTNDVYSDYKLWCGENGLKPVAKLDFSRQLCKRFKVTTKSTKVGGLWGRVYTKASI